MPPDRRHFLRNDGGGLHLATVSCAVCMRAQFPLLRVFLLHGPAGDEPVVAAVHPGLSRHHADGVVRRDVVQRTAKGQQVGGGGAAGQRVLGQVYAHHRPLQAGGRLRTECPDLQGWGPAFHKGGAGTRVWRQQYSFRLFAVSRSFRDDI